jgi:hypothetical protein
MTFWGSHPNPLSNLSIQTEIIRLCSIEERSLARLGGGRAPSFDFAQDREPAERPVERQMMP